MVNIKSILKIGVKFIGPAIAGAMTVMSELEDHKLKETVKELAARVAELEKK